MTVKDASAIKSDRTQYLQGKEKEMKREEELKVLIDCLLNGFLQEQMKKDKDFLPAF